MADLRLYAAVRPTTLATGSVLGATTLTPSVIKDREDNSIGTMATYFGTKSYGVLSPGKDREEHFTFTGISAGVLTGVSHITMTAPYTETSGLNEAHSAGEVIVLMTNAPGFYNDFANKQNDETVAATWTFSETTLPRSSASHSYIAGEEEFFATKRYADGVALSGAPDASTTQKGVVEEATQAEVDARTASGSAARLFVNPTTLRTVLMHDYAADAGANDTYAITVTPAPTAYVTGDVYFFKANTINTGAATLNVNSLGAKTIVKSYNVTLADGDIKANQIVGVIYDGTNFQLLSPVNMDEAQTFFANTDITGAEAETLTSGPSSNATTKHIHAYAGTPFEITFTRAESAGYVSVPNINSAIGWTDENDLLTYTYSDTGTTDRTTNYRFSDAALVGVQPYNSRRDLDTGAGFNMTTAVNNGALFIGTDRFHSNGTSIFKNGSALTFSGTSRYGKLAHNPTTSSLLVLYSTTVIAQFSGIAGTTITNLNTDITLDTAVNNTINFIYDNTNSRYIAVDTINSVIRRFNSSGVTVDTVSYVDMLVGEESNSLAGICIFQDRVFLIIADSRGHMTVTASSTDTASRHRLRFYPTAMTR